MDLIPVRTVVALLHLSHDELAEVRFRVTEFHDLFSTDDLLQSPVDAKV